MKLLQLLLRALVPLLERRCVAAERQAAATERIDDLLRTYLGQDPEFRDLLAGVLPVAEELADPPDVLADHGAERDLKAQRLEAIGALFYERFGSIPDDEQVMRMYEQMYEADQRADPAVDGPGVAH